MNQLQNSFEISDLRNEVERLNRELEQVRKGCVDLEERVRELEWLVSPERT